MFEHHRHLTAHFRFIKNKKLIELYLVLALTTLGYSVVGLFVPIYMLSEIGFPFINVIYYLMVAAATGIFTFPLALKLSSRIGVNKTLLLSIPFKIAFIVMLDLLKAYDIPLTLIGITSSLSVGLFWLPYHQRFTKISDHKHRGTELGLRFALNNIFAIVGPLLGGLIATYLGFTFLYVVAGILFAVAAIPLLFIKEEHIGKDFKLIDILRGRTYRELLSYVSEGARFYGWILWTIFMFLVIKSYVELGGIVSGVTLFTGLVQVTVGYFSDTVSGKKLLRIGTIIDAVTWFIRTIFTTVYSLFAVTAVSGLGVSLWYVPYASKVYDKFSKKDGTAHIIFREYGLICGRLIILLLALMVGLKWSIISTGLLLFLLWLF